MQGEICIVCSVCTRLKDTSVVKTFGISPGLNGSRIISGNLGAGSAIHIIIRTVKIERCAREIIKIHSLFCDNKLSEFSYSAKGNRIIGSIHRTC